jgi:hypothetical protein
MGAFDNCFFRSVRKTENACFPHIFYRFSLDPVDTPGFDTALSHRKSIPNPHFAACGRIALHHLQILLQVSYSEYFSIPMRETDILHGSGDVHKELRR